MLRIIACCCLTATAAWSAIAAEPVRWKFAPGDVLRHELRQESATEFSDGEGAPLTTDLTQEMVFRVEVNRVRDDGSAELTQTIERIKFDASSAAVQNTHYDSSSEEPAEGLGAMVAPMFDAMVGAPITLTMSPRGEVTDVVLDEKLAESLKSNPMAKTAGAVFSEAGLKRAIEQSSMVLPEGPSSDSQPVSVADVESPFGVQRATTIYTFIGDADGSDGPVQAWKSKTELSFVGTPPAGKTAKVSKQQSAGTVRFDAEAGRWLESEQEQSFTIESTVMDKPVTTRTTQKVGSSWSEW